MTEGNYTVLTNKQGVTTTGKANRFNHKWAY